jgi:hypothetical protein
MRTRSRYATAAAALFVLACPAGYAGRCTGAADCRARTNCSRCAHCAEGGGSCGVCVVEDEDNLAQVKAATTLLTLAGCFPEPSRAARMSAF